MNALGERHWYQRIHISSIFFPWIRVYGHIVWSGTFSFSSNHAVLYCRSFSTFWQPMPGKKCLCVLLSGNWRNECMRPCIVCYVLKRSVTAIRPTFVTELTTVLLPRSGCGILKQEMQLTHTFLASQTMPIPGAAEYLTPRSLIHTTYKSQSLSIYVLIYAWGRKKISVVYSVNSWVK